MVIAAKTFSAVVSTKNDKASGRPSGWAPLVYPASAIIQEYHQEDDSIPLNDSTEVNPFFPLDRHVLTASIRELLILDGSVDGQSLKTTSKKAVYNGHVDSSEWTKIQSKEIVLFIDDNKITLKSKRKMVAPHTDRKKPRIALKTEINDNTDDSVVVQTEKTISAESIAATILKRALNPIRKPHPSEADSTALSPEIEELLERPPRKISDADAESLATGSEMPNMILLFDTDEICSGNDMSRFVDVSNRLEEGSIRFIKDSLPRFLEVSIVFESKLRNIAFQMVSEMLKSFDNETIRLFMGYRTKTMKRQRIIRMLADFLFDVSHAMFAWKQTEREIRADLTASEPAVHSVYTQKTDGMVCNALFDCSRALKKIGGFDDSSILKHAVEISRSAAKHQTWEDFAKTVSGRRLLAHHRSGNAGEVGTKRRGRRTRNRVYDGLLGHPACDYSTTEVGQRSRASSIASSEEIETGVRADNTKSVVVCSTNNNNNKEGFVVAAPPVKISDFCDASEIVLRRENSKCSWGVKLAREGDICVVDRAGAVSDNNNNNDSSLRCGDMILSIKNDRNEVAGPPTSGVSSPPGWFQNIVSLFKTSNELTLIVRRVGC